MRKGNISHINNCNIHVDSEKYEILLLAEAFEDRWKYGFRKNKLEKRKNYVKANKRNSLKAFFVSKSRLDAGLHLEALKHSWE